MYHLQVQCMLQMQVQVTMLIKPVNPLKLLAWQEPTIQTQVRQVSLLVLAQVQVTMLTLLWAQVNPAKQHV